MTPASPARLARILTMVPYIQRHPGIRVRELADYLGCRTGEIMADIDAVLLCGVPPYLPNDYIGIVLEGDRIYISFADHFKRPVNLTIEEALSLGLALGRLPLAPGAQSAAADLQRKIAALLPGPSRGQWTEARRRLQAGTLHDEVRRRIAALEEAVEARRETHIEYYTAGRDELTARDVRPLGIVEHNGEWYLIAFCLLRDRELPFRIDRIRALRPLDRTFTPPPGFAIAKYARPQFYFPTARDLRVKLRVAPDLARWVVDEPLGGRTHPTADGGVLLYLSVSQPQWVVSWVLEHAGKVELLAPEALRRQVAASARRALANYA
jgi:proteasome accessory factor C